MCIVSLSIRVSTIIIGAVEARDLKFASYKDHI